MLSISGIFFSSFVCFLFVKMIQGYLKSLGMARTAEVKRDARIGEAEARADAQIKGKFVIC